MLRIILISTLLKIAQPNQLYDVSCDQCIQGGNIRCLSDAQFWGLDGGTCCQAGSKNGYCRFTQKRNTFCATNDQSSSKYISNPVLQSWTCSAKENKCPNDMKDIKVTIDNFQEYNRQYDWEFRVPDPSFDFHCKYQIGVSQAILEKQKKEKGSIGYIMVQTEQNGFDESVNIIVQPKKDDKTVFTDYIKGQDKTIDSIVYENIPFSKAFFIPAEYDVLISFAPVNNLATNKIGQSFMGRFRFRTWYQQYIDVNAKSDPNVQIVYRYDPTTDQREPVNPDEAEKTEVQIQKQEEQSAGQNNTLIDSGIINGKKIDWNGNVVPDEKWYDKTLFTIDDFDVSTGVFAAGSASLIILIAGITFAICSFLAYRKRKVLASQIRRVSEYANRMSVKIRQSIAGSQMNQTVDDNESVVQPTGKNQAKFFKEMQKAQTKEQERELQYMKGVEQTPSQKDENIPLQDKDGFSAIVEDLDQDGGVATRTQQRTVKFDSQNEEISVKSGSIYEKQSEFRGYVSKQDSNPLNIDSKVRGFTRVNNILQELEGLSDLNDMQSQLGPDHEILSPTSVQQYRRGTMQSNMSAIGKDNQKQFLNLIANSRVLIDNLVKEEEQLEEQVPLTSDASEIQDKSDQGYLSYVNRKESIIQNLEQATGMAYHINDDKYKSTVAALHQALNEEQSIYNVKRNTLLKKKS